MPTANLITLKGTFRHIIDLSAALTETVTLAVPQGLVIVDNDDHELRITQEPQRFTLQQIQQGVTVVATDDVNCNPQRWYYLLTESWSDRKNVPVVLPSDAPGGIVRYESLANAGDLDQPVYVPIVVKSVNGYQPDASGSVIVPLPTGGGGGGTPDLSNVTVGGVLAGNILAPTFASPMYTQAQINALIANYGRPLGFWAAGTVYSRNDLVVYRKTGQTGGTLYRCNTAHTSTAAFDFGKFDDWGLQTVASDARYFPAPWAAATQYATGQLALRPGDNAIIQRIAGGTTGQTYDGTSWLYLAGGTTSGGTTPTAGSSLDVPAVKTASYTLQLTDVGKEIETNSASLLTLTIPPHSLVPIPVGTTIPLRQIGTGQAEVLAGATVTIRTPYTTRTRGQWSVIGLFKRDYNEWVLQYDLATSIPAPTTVNSITANFTSSTYAAEADVVNYAVTGYTGQAGDIRYNTTVQGHAQRLGNKMFRLAFKWVASAGKPYNGAQGAINDAAGIDAWVTGIYAANPNARIVGLLEGEEEMECTPDDATNIVSYCQAKGWNIHDWAVGNEPENTGEQGLKKDYLGRAQNDGRNYGKLFCELGPAVRAVDSTAKLWGPTQSAWGGKSKFPIANATDPGNPTQFANDFLTTVWNGTSVAELLDVFCWHRYISGTVSSNNNGIGFGTQQLMAQAVVGGHHNELVTGVRPMIDAYVTAGNWTAAQRDKLKFSLNEWNIYYQPKTEFTSNGVRTVRRTGLKDEFGTWYDERCTTAEGTVFVALALRSTYRNPNFYFIFFADKAGPLGWLTRNPYDLTADPQLLGDNMGSNPTAHFPHGKPENTPYPTYWGMIMYQGGGLFRKFGTNMATIPTPTTITPNFQMTASTNNGGDIILINHDEVETRLMEVTTTGITSGPVDLWQTVRYAPWDPPKKLASTTISGSKFQVVLPPMTVTRAVINP